MNVDELQSVRDSERRTDSLQELRESFYADAGEFIQELRDRRERAAERADDPFDAPEVDRLSSEINAAEETVEAIYEKRLGKLVKAASLAAAGMPAGTDGMTAEEQQLFDTLVADIRANRQHVLDVLAGEESDPEEPTDGERRSGTADAGAASTGTGESDAGAESPGPSTAAGDDRTVDAAAAMGEPASRSPETAPKAAGESDRSSDRAGPETDREGQASHRGPAADGDSDVSGTSGDGGRHESGPAGDDSEPTAGDVDRERVRITADVGAIFGVDEREYDLSENDVVQLPRENAEPLLDQDAAERL